jgi:tripartite ATP-independent transporter DctM subunit
MQNFTLIAVPLFIFMGLILEKSNMAGKLLESMGKLFGNVRGGVAISVVLVGAILAASTGIVGASVVMMSVIALPIMINYGYDKSLASGVIASSGTLGQIIPPSIVLIILGDVMSVSVGELFKAALIPGLLLVGLYILYILVYSYIYPDRAPAIVDHEDDRKTVIVQSIKAIFPPLLLMVVVLGSIFMGVASPTESAAIGVVGAMVLAWANRTFSREMMTYAMSHTVKLTGMIFMILLGATAFSLVFHELGGSDTLIDLFEALDVSAMMFVILAMVLIFLLGFFIDFVEIAFIVVPIMLPIVEFYGIDPIWFALLVAINLQASFLTPPFGFALFYLKGASRNLVATVEIYKGVIPFIGLQLFALAILMTFPNIIKF